MRGLSIQKETIEAYKNRFVKEGGLGINGTAGSECILFCKKVSPTIFDIKDGVALLSGTGGYYNDGVCMISNFMKVVFVFDQAQEDR
jgi:hypothetical protein